MTQLVPAHEGNFTHGRNGHAITRGYFHRTAVKGDTAIGEANYFKSHIVQASAGVFIDLDGVVIQSVADTDTEWAVNELDENLISFSIEFTGLNGTPLTAKQIASAIAFIKGDKLIAAIPKHRLSITEIPPRKVGGWANHRDVTTAYKIAGGHTDAISEPEIAQILRGV